MLNSVRYKLSNYNIAILKVSLMQTRTLSDVNYHVNYK